MLLSSTKYNRKLKVKTSNEQWLEFFRRCLNRKPLVKCSIDQFYTRLTENTAMRLHLLLLLKSKCSKNYKILEIFSKNLMNAEFSTESAFQVCKTNAKLVLFCPIFCVEQFRIIMNFNCFIGKKIIAEKIVCSSCELMMKCFVLFQFRYSSYNIWISV